MDPPEELKSVYPIAGRDFTNAGRISTAIMDILKRLGADPEVVRRVAIASYEAEMNVVMYALRGTISLRVSPQAVTIEVKDEGPGIEDIDLAMQEGYSTATPEMQEMGFGAGMGLPNIKKIADEFEITSEVSKGTQLYIRVNQIA
ncbi:MAG: ATP-binding protein [Acidobacteriia bacterium]|nr:ATP-binding protein [Terriglobia bacterium]